MSRSEWYTLLCKSLSGERALSPFGDPLPRFPSEELQRNTTSLSGEQALLQASGFYSDLGDALDSRDIRIEPNWMILDFGSCWGRISRFFMRDVPKRNIQGVDVEKGFVDICNDLFDSDAFSVCQAMPPLEFVDSTVSLISAYSVFSHLSETAFLAWMHEFGRILKPGGIIAFTTRNEGFLDYCENLNAHKNELTGYQLALATAVGGDAELRQKYHSGEFVFVSSRGVNGGGSMNESFYGETFIPYAYIRNHLANNFEILDYKSIGQTYDQALFVLRKRP
jgi:SAM-dependent methyltransferase